MHFRVFIRSRSFFTGRIKLYNLNSSIRFNPQIQRVHFKLFSQIKKDNKFFNFSKTTVFQKLHIFKNSTFSKTPLFQKLHFLTCCKFFPRPGCPEFECPSPCPLYFIKILFLNPFLDIIYPRWKSASFLFAENTLGLGSISTLFICLTWPTVSPRIPDKKDSHIMVFEQF